ncbi:autotransporter assembly complex protein TamB [Candidatus Enterovibrio altilux]|uniref:autotransporter assembly complex protein TamB n=1 Tax=Candidatus Enterovibrio altilux TaxID=1927128 RepID=UPI0016819FEB|nr:translocation/assembly module TamB domain-containing protein [Candidatus Enterovibrio luxaltus]
MRWIKNFFIAIIGLLMIVSVAIGAFFIMPGGVKFAVLGFQEILPALSIDDQEGSVLNGFTLTGVSYQSPSLSLTSKSLSLDINAKCLLTLVLCIDGFIAEDMVVTVSEIESSPEEDTPFDLAPITEISTPVPLFLSNIVLNNITFNILGTKVYWDSLITAAQMQQSTLTLKHTEWKGINVELAPSEVDSEDKETYVTTLNKESSQEAFTLPDVNIPFNLVIEHFEVIEADFFLPEKQTIHQFLLQGHGFGNDVSLEQVVLDAEQGKVTLKGDISLKGEYPLILEGDASISMAPLGSHTLKFDAKGDLKKLDVVAKLKGTLFATLSGHMNVLDPDMPFSLMLTSKSLQWPINASAEYRLISTALCVNGSLADYHATLNTSVMGEMIPNIKLSMDLFGNLSKVSLTNIKLDTLDGYIAGSANISWINEVKWQTSLNFNHIQPGMKWPVAAGQFSGKLKHSGQLTSQGGWQVDVDAVDIQGKLYDQELTLVGQVDVSDIQGEGNVTLKTTGLWLRHGPNMIVVAGRTDKELKLDLTLDLSSLAVAVPQAAGSIKGNVILAGTLKAPTASLNLRALALHWDELVSVSSAKIRGSVSLLPIISGSFIIDVEGVKAKGIDVSTLLLKISGNEYHHSVSLNVNGQPVSANVAIRGSLDRKKGWKGTLYDSKITTPVGPWVLQNDVSIFVDFDSRVVDIETFCWTQHKSYICLDKPANISEKGEVEFTVVNFNLDSLQFYLPITTTIQGEMDAHANVSWKPNTLPTANVSVSMLKGQVTELLDEPLTIGWNKIQLNAVLVDEKLSVDFMLDIINNGSLSLNIEMNNLSNKKHTLKSTFFLNALNLDVLAPLLGEGTRLGGQLNGNVVLNGALNAPTANGSINFTGLKLESYTMPVKVHKGQISLYLAGYKGQLNGEIKTPDGTVTLTGQADWTKFNEWLASLKITSERLKVVASPMVALEVNPNLTLTANPKQIDIMGTINVPWGRIVVKELPEIAVQISSDIVILGDELKSINKRKRSPMTIHAEIDVNISNDVRLEAFGLKTMLEGQLSMVSNKKGPVINGKINLKEGTYRSFGQDLLIKKGQILFNGPPLQPYLQIEAIRNPDNIIDRIEAGIRVHGPANKPEIWVFSDPAMPLANAVSYLVRGIALDSASDRQAIVSMLMNLSLLESGPLVSQLGDVFGVQDLMFDISGIGKAEKVEVSGYILPKLRVKYGMVIFTHSPEFTVRYQLLKNLYVEVMSGASSAVDLLYQFNIK